MQHVQYILCGGRGFPSFGGKPYPQASLGSEAKIFYMCSKISGSCKFLGRFVRWKLKIQIYSLVFLKDGRVQMFWSNIIIFI